MPEKNLHILVILRETCDPKPPARVGPSGGRISDRGLRRFPNPADMVALEVALRLAEGGGSVTALAVGPSRLDDMLCLAKSMGAARTIRVWDHALEDGDACADARVLSRIWRILQSDFIFSGNRLLDRGDDPALRFAAALYGRPCVGAALEVDLQGGKAQIERKSDRGARQRVETTLPCAVQFEADACEVRYPSHQAVMGALEAECEVWGLPELGLPARSLGAAGAVLPLVDFGFPRQQPLRVVTPDATLPAFDRILALLSGGIKPREGKLNALPAEQTAEKLLRIFEAEGLIGGKSP